MADPQSWLKFELGNSAKPVNADAFVGVFRSTLDTLKALDRGLSTHGVETVEWQVSEAGSHSPIFATLTGKSKSSRDGKRYAGV